MPTLEDEPWGLVSLSTLSLPDLTYETKILNARISAVGPVGRLEKKVLIVGIRITLPNLSVSI
jgi:hypothetical protein